MSETKKEKQAHIVIAGAGASGLCAAVLCARAGLRVRLLEKGQTPGKKLSMTGNGRCNLSNLYMDAACYNEGARDLVQAVLSRYGVQDTIRFFRSTGILLRNEEGCLYPVSGEAQSVTDALLSAFAQAGGVLVTDAQVKEILRTAEGYAVRCAAETYPADAVVIATGGRSGPKTTCPDGDGYYLAEKLGLPVTGVLPALNRLQCEIGTLPDKGGVRVYAEASFFASGTCFARERGEVQLTRHAISGIPVLQASADCAAHLGEGEEVTVFLNLFPETLEEEMRRLIGEQCGAASGKTLAQWLNGFGHHLINETVIRRFGFAPGQMAEELPRGMREALLWSYTSFPVSVSATGAFAYAQATRGGIRTDSVTEELEAKTCPGLYVCGEVLDVDGRCGGYNLQWAWSSAMAVAGGICRRFT